MRKALLYICWRAVIGTSLISLASAQLTSTKTSKLYTCSGAPINYYEYEYSDWQYKDSSGVTHSFPGDTLVENRISYTCGDGAHTCYCAANIDTSLSSLSTDAAYYLQATGGSGNAYAVNAGWINAKYKIVDVEYSPPGASSTVTYTNDTVVGSSSMFSGSFSSSIAESISVTSGFSIAGFSDKQTATDSTTYGQEQDTSSSIAVSETTTNQNQISGYSDPVTGLNHDYDYIHVWLNPILQFSFYTDSTEKNHVIWTGYGYDLNDTKAAPDMDVIGIQLGCLNGDFYNQYASGANQNWLSCEDVFNNNFNRSWALNNTDGSGPALTPTLAESAPPYNFCAQTGTDLYYICQADPFANPSYGATNFPPAAGSYSSKDGRFTACSNSLCTTTIDYQPGSNPGFSQAYSTTTSSSQGSKYNYSTSFSIESQFGWSATGCKPSDWCGTFSTDTKQTTTYTWTDQFSQSTNNSTGKTAAFSIKGPAEGYSGTDQFVLYQDNLYGTFMFYPGN